MQLVQGAPNEPKSSDVNSGFPKATVSPNAVCDAGHFKDREQRNGFLASFGPKSSNIPTDVIVSTIL